MIIVVTMLTQAFSFEAIRVMEGYWATWSWFEAVGDHWTRRSVKRHDRLDQKYNHARRRAWAESRPKIEMRQAELERKNRPRELSDRQIIALETLVLGGGAPDGITRVDVESVVGWDWEKYASPQARRRQLNAELKRDDFPEDMGHVMPTRLGCVLRRYEDAMGRDEVEGFVDEHFDALPFSMQLTHDEQRARLELYCAMVFVLLFAGAIGIARFGFAHYPWQLATAVLTVAGCRLVYRAGIASARYYGKTLVSIADYVDAQANQS